MAKTIISVINLVRTIKVSEFGRVFKLCSQNRTINREHVNKLAASILETGIFAPIIINGQTLVVEDGHHRYMAALAISRMLGIDLEIPYIFVEPKVSDFQALLAINNVSKQWNSRNYCESALRSGDKNYRALYEYAKAYGLINPNTRLPKMRIVSAYIGNKAIEEYVRKGEYDKLALTNVEWKHAHMNAQSINKMLREMERANKGNIPAVSVFATSWATFRLSKEFKELVIAQKGEVNAMRYIANNFDFRYVKNKTTYLQGFRNAALGL